MKTIISKYASISLAVIALLFISPINALAQDEAATEEEAKPEKKAEKPVRSPWAAGMLIETQTDLVWNPGTLEMVMQHRFGNLNSETFDLLGIYGSSNIRIGFNYGLFKNAQIGVATTKIGSGIYTDINWKYKILTQTKSNSMPIAMTYYGNTEIRLGNEDPYGTNYKFTDRMSYFHQLIISRKVNKNLSVMVSGNFAYFNQIDTSQASGFPTLEHGNFSLTFAGRYRINSNTAIMVEYEQPLTTPGAAIYVNRDTDMKNEQVGLRNLSLGVELATSSHAFHIFLTTYRNISYAQNLTYNTNFFTDGAILLGFNITRNWNF